MTIFHGSEISGSRFPTEGFINPITGSKRGPTPRGPKEPHGGIYADQEYKLSDRYSYGGPCFALFPAYNEPDFNILI